MSNLSVRRARPDDHDAVAAFTGDTWPDRDVDDWIPEVFPQWIEADGDDRQTLVAEVDGEVVGVCNGLMLSASEAWVQGIRVHPDHRGTGVSQLLTDRLLSWCRARGAVVARNMVFSWNAGGLGQSRAMGFEPTTEIRLAHPTPDPDASADGIGTDPAVAWRYWRESDAREHLRGLALDDEESWALRALTRDDLERAADEDALFVVESAEGVRGMAFRSRLFEYETDGEHETDDGTERVAEYGTSAWEDLYAARRLFAAIQADAAAVEADRTRVLIPESVQWVSDVAACRVAIADEPAFVLSADLTADRPT